HNNLPISNSQYLGIGIMGLLFYFTYLMSDEVRERRLRGKIGEATGERMGRNLEEADGGVTGVATGDYGRR
ncbi:hypothetical protein HAX54_032773, partial [Datura stramonium]|nr:hypothetical protein [Datura stramonium]